MDEALFWVILFVSLGVMALYASSSPKQKNGHLAPKQDSKKPFQKSFGLTGSNTSAKSEEEILYRKLLSMVLGDKRVAERLIEFERKKFPNVPRSELILTAIERLRR